MACKTFLIIISGMAFEARIAQGRGHKTVYGLDPAKLECDIEAAIGQGAIGILSFGTAAGLIKELSPGSVVVARLVLWQEKTWQADEAWTARLCAAIPEARLGNLAGVDAPLKTAQEKALLQAETGTIAADMESHHVARLAQRHRLPFAALRIVLDGADRALPPVALAAVRNNGTIAYDRLLGSLLAQPEHMPALRQLAFDNRVAKRSLRRCGELLRDLFVVDFG